MKQLVAVYGSLRQGLHNHSVLGDSEYLGDDAIDGFDMYSLGSFPYIVDGDGQIKVEVYSVGITGMERLDCLEGYPNFYNRKKVKTNHGDAWIYFWNENEVGNAKVSNGDWLDFYNKSKEYVVNNT